MASYSHKGGVKCRHTFYNNIDRYERCEKEEAHTRIIIVTRGGCETLHVYFLASAHNICAL